MNQAGQSGFAGGEAAALGQMAGSIAFNTVLGREQTYYFKEPGYIFDMLTIRPVYFWTGIRPGAAAFFSQVMPFNHRAALPNSLISWLRVANSPIVNYPKNTVPPISSFLKITSKFVAVNADTYLGNGIS